MLFGFLFLILGAKADEPRTLSAGFEAFHSVASDGHALSSSWCSNVYGGEEQERYSPDINQCMKDICGAPKDNSTDILTDHNIDSFLPNRNVPGLDKMEASIDAAFEAEKKKNQAFLQRGRELFEDATAEEAIKEFSPADWERIVHTVYGPYINVISNPFGTKVSDQISVTPKTNLEGLDPSMKAQVEKYAEDLEKKLREESWHHQITHRTVTLEKAQELLLRNYMTLAQQIKQKTDGRSFISKLFKGDEQNLNQEINDKIRNIRELSFPEIIETTRKLRNLHFRVLEDEAPKEALCSSEGCQEGITSYMESLDFEKILGNLERTNNEGKPDRVKYDCRMQVLADQILTPNLEQIQKDIPVVMAKFKRNVIQHFSYDSRESFNNVVRQELEFRYPRLAAQGERSADRLNLGFERVKAKADIQSSEEYKEKINTGDVLSWIFSKQGDAYSDLNPCGEKRPEVGGDRFEAFQQDREGKKYFIEVSPHTCRHTHSGKGTVAHELGHLLSVLFSSGKMSSESKKLYEKIRKCSNLGYKNLEAMPGSGLAKFEGDHIKSEEDTADLIAMLALQHDTEGTPAACKTLVPNKNGLHYNHSSLLSPEGSHSAPPLRVIIEQIHRQKPLSDSCKKLTEEYKGNLRFGRCF